MSIYEVTATPKYPGYHIRPITVTVDAKSKREANKSARDRLEREGYYFHGDDAMTFSAKKVQS